jgi:AraC-like DNA-binding protein
MDIKISYMDYFSIHLEPLPRRYPFGLQVRTIGYLPHKTDWVRSKFGTFNFSFILRGGGEYRMGSRVWSVQAPCVITQWPGIHVEYGPGEFWEELYLIYSAEFQPLLEQRRFADLSRPVWYIRELGPTRRRLTELRVLLADPTAFGRADEIDRIAEHMVLESLISESRPDIGRSERIIQEIQGFLEENYARAIDFDLLAAEHGLSPTTFRRYWGAVISTSPGQYVARLRIRQACRMLAETKKPIGEIAQAVGYEDVLYFSRRFHQVVGETASAYRRRNRSPLSLPQAE